MCKIGVVKLKQNFPRSRWGDTLKTKDEGKVIRVPDLSQYFDMYFLKPIPRKNIKSIIETIQKYKEVKSIQDNTLTYKQSQKF